MTRICHNIVTVEHEICTIEVLNGIPRNINGRVWKIKQENVITQPFTHVCKTAKIDDLRFHDLRHEGISRLFERGMGIQEVAMVSGHRDWKSLQRYVNLRAGDVASKYR